MSTENDYAPNATKQDPVTGILAQRTMFDGDRAWRVLGNLQHDVAHKDVEHWTDLTP